MAGKSRGKNLTEAVAYVRTSSAANVGADKDSDKRQRAAIDRFARSSGFGIVGEFYDPGVSGADPIETRAGFATLLDCIENNGVRTVIVEDASRFARELMAQELGISLLIARGVRLFTTTGDELTASEDPTRKMMRQIAGAFAEYEKARLVGKLKSARDRKRNVIGKVEGRKSFAERAAGDPGKNRPADKSIANAMREAKRLYRASPVTGNRRSLREVAGLLAEKGYLNQAGRAYNPKSVRAMIKQRIGKPDDVAG